MPTTKSPLVSVPRALTKKRLKSGGRVERIEGCPDPEGRVLRRGWRDRPAIGTLGMMKPLFGFRPNPNAAVARSTPKSPALA
jgi:hypothetical protein